MIIWKRRAIRVIMYNGSKRSKTITEENKFCVSWDPGSHLLDIVCAGEERRG